MASNRDFGKPARTPARSRLADWLAPRLGVADTRTRIDWFVRLLFHAPRAGRKDVPQLLIARFVALLAGDWQLAARAPLRLWLWRAFVRPAPPGGAAASLRAIVVGTAVALRRTTAFARRQQRRLDAAIARLPWVPLAAGLESASGVVGRWWPMLPVVMLLGGALFVLASTASLSTTAQLQFGATSLAASLVIRRMPGRVPLLLLSSMALLMTARYAYWRATTTLDFRSPGDTLVGYALFGAEAYTWLIQLFGFVQTAWPLERAIVPMPVNPAAWPTVDVYIPTYNEPLSVVRPTVLAAQGIDWPADKLRVYLLDDGRRPEFRAFAEQAGIEYLVREDNRHAKAGNINRALERTHGEYIAIFDCDHVPARSFLQTTMGTFLREPKCAMVQTPHHFFSPDPFERNLSTFHRVPNEGYLFYGLVQAGNDLWNASFFCGSCAVIRRSALVEVGGVAVETVTEDAHTALKLHRRGYTTAYLPTVQAAGLATESLASHIRQRVRWARGMAQIFRIDNPFLGRGLTAFQRLCYGNAMLHFFYGIPRLIFLTMPMAYLFFHMHFIHAPALAIVAYVMPYIALANVANSRLQGSFRHSFWAEVYESVLAWYVALPTTIAVLSPKHGKFNVTDKGGRIDQGYFDWAVSRPYILLVTLNALGLAVGCYSLVAGDAYEAPTVLMNMLWTTYNLVLLGGALCVAREARQTRATQRIPMRLPAMLMLADGHSIACTTRDCSLGGFGLTLPDGQRFAPGEPMSVCVRRLDQEFSFRVRSVWQTGRELGVKLEGLDLEAERRLVQLTLGRADAWIKWHDAELADKPLRGLRDVVQVGVRGYGRLGRDAARAARAWVEAARARS
ncbi:UDP-forming cellulose synthase catalytic subunit [Caballeronia sp. LZ062]|uniref:UDP-forming cellulose synthase catalytic subunit n=1 Tax=unclassified Caballeronia TaxID=2646786 RepID=UPI0028647B73|nr:MULTISPECIES: UDP-forming cellulose synthase catalytic subunit [unclassified Caballeronia]MDR5856201.1 UDP-forming cellulose synthase catalytic subunit [Caballeronia sp. LZ050]MDR5872872.1 UDP-forming cellulose synthase catalytic subunit [Caballeronia sp. LZ062]